METNFMGLTITYRFKLDSATIEEAREKIITLRNIALKFPLIEVGGLLEFSGKDCIADENNRENDVNYFLKLQAVRLDCGATENGQPVFLTTNPTYMIAFNTVPGDGSETAFFGLALYQEVQEKNDWTWFSFCKTQYASNPEYGGIENFVRCHTFVITMLEEAEKLGITCKVTDEGGYWPSKNLEDLIKNVTDSNFLMAAVMGAFKNVFSDQGIIQAPVLDYPNFEYLEAEGRDLLDNK
jgi:hypothetical protein